MTVVVSFIRAGGIGGNAQGIAGVRAKENLTIPATTVGVTLPGETVVIGNGEATMVTVAFGVTPDAGANTESPGVTSAGYPIGAGQTGIPFSAAGGSKINVKAVP